MNKNYSEEEYYLDLFNHAMESNEYILDSDNNILVLDDEETFKQCYAPIPGRRLFPKFWFVSNKGNLVSVAKDKPLWLKCEQKGNYQFYHFWNAEKGQNKQITRHGLVALVFDSDIIGRAVDILERDGIYAFGRSDKNKPDTIQTHHKYSVTNRPDLYNDPDNLQIMTAELHSLIDNPPKRREEEYDYIKQVEAHFPDIKNAGYGIIWYNGDVHDRTTGKLISQDSERALYIFDPTRVEIKPQLMNIYTFKEETTNE